MQPKKEQLPSFQDMYIACFGFWDKKHKLASDFFGVSEQTCRRWFDTGNPHETAHRYLTVHYHGYLPFARGWRDAYIDKDGLMHTPHGTCTYGDLCMLWRWKWAAENNSKQVKQLRAKIDELSNGSKLNLLTHTVDYLSKLVQELSP